MLKTSYFSACIIITMAKATAINIAGSQENEVPSYDFSIVTRDQWNARKATETLPLITPVSYVTIHHSQTPGACYDLKQCSRAMRTIQNMHMDANGWWDIGYSFAVGSDGSLYEGRGWEILGAHALYFNTVSIGILLIGDWTGSIPPAAQLKTAKAIIAAGVELGYIKPDYRLVGHRQVRATDCPGQALFDEIKHWHHYSNFPASPKDLVYIQEIPEDSKDKIRNQTMSVPTQ